MIAEEATEGESRKSDRVTFERGVDVYMMAIDGTWRRDCIMKEASDSGAKLLVRGSIEGLNLKDFFCCHPPVWPIGAANCPGSMETRLAQTLRSGS
jgi:hypothetical protein